MNLKIDESPSYTEVEISVKCPKIDNELGEIIDRIKMYGFAIHGYKEGKTFIVKPSEIFYIDSVDDKTFIYCEKEVFECRHRLYVLEEKLQPFLFIRISKSCIVNVNLIEGFEGKLNGKLEAHMQNGEKLIVSRHYVAALKECLKEMEGKL